MRPDFFDIELLKILEKVNTSEINGVKLKASKECKEQFEAERWRLLLALKLAGFNTAFRASIKGEKTAEIKAELFTECLKILDLNIEKWADEK